MTGRRWRAVAGACAVSVGLAGCATVDLRAGFDEVGATVAERSSAAITWQDGAGLDEATAARLRDLLARPLTADAAVQVALLGNRDLQALYSDLGLARADLVQAGLFRNPVLDAGAMLPLTGARPDLQLGVAISLLDALYVPPRKRVAAAQLEEVKLRVAGGVLDLVARVRTAYYVHQANEQLLELRRTSARALAASYEVSRRLHAAGNISDLDLARDRAQTELARLTLRAAEVEARRSAEELNELMGLWGLETAWEIDGRLPEIPDQPPPAEDLERVAVARSLSLAHARQQMVTAGQRLGFSRASALVPEMELGAEAEREGAEGWKVGPSVAVPLPLFDQGQARIARTAAELRRVQHEYHALAVRIRATARAVQERLAGARERALYYRDIVLPLRGRIVNEAQLHYNAMQIGIGQLLREREQQIETGVAYVEALRDYWLARTDETTLASGRLPGAAGVRPGGAAPVRAMEGGGH